MGSGSYSKGGGCAIGGLLVDEEVIGLWLEMEEVSG